MLFSSSPKTIFVLPVIVLPECSPVTIKNCCLDVACHRFEGQRHLAVPKSDEWLPDMVNWIVNTGRGRYQLSVNVFWGGFYQLQIYEDPTSVRVEADRIEVEDRMKLFLVTVPSVCAYVYDIFLDSKAIFFCVSNYDKRYFSNVLCFAENTSNRPDSHRSKLVQFFMTYGKHDLSAHF